MNKCLLDMGVRGIYCGLDLSCAGTYSLHKQDLLISFIFTVSAVMIARDISYFIFTTVISSSHWNTRTPMNERIFVA